MDLRLMLHFSPSQRKETACMDAVSSWLHDLLTEAITLYASSVAFPEYVAPAVTEVSPHNYFLIRPGHFLPEPSAI